MAAIDGLLRATHQELGAARLGAVAGREHQLAGAHAQLKLPGAPVDDGVVQTDGRHHSAEREPEPELLSAAAPPGGCGPAPARTAATWHPLPSPGGARLCARPTWFVTLRLRVGRAAPHDRCEETKLDSCGAKPGQEHRRRGGRAARRGPRLRCPAQGTEPARLAAPGRARRPASAGRGVPAPRCCAACERGLAPSRGGGTAAAPEGRRAAGRGFAARPRGPSRLG